MAYRRFAAFRLADTKLGSELRFRCHTYRPLALHAGVRCVHDSANAVLRLLGQHWTESVARRHLISAWGDGRSGGRRMSRSERPPDLAQGARILAAGGAAPLSAGEQRSGWSERRDLNSGPPVPQTGALTGLRYAPPRRQLRRPLRLRKAGRCDAPTSSSAAARVRARHRHQPPDHAEQQEIMAPVIAVD